MGAVYSKDFMFFFSSRRRHTRFDCDWSSDVCSSDLGVTLDPEKEVNLAIGSKPALAMLPAAFINLGDITLMTVPGYPVAGTHTKYYGEIGRASCRERV